MGQSLAIPRVIPHDWKRLDLIVSKIKMRLGRDASHTMAGLTLTGLTASTLIGANASKALESITVGTGLNYTRPNLTLSHLGIEALTDPGADRIMFWDNSASACKWLACGNSIAITTTTIDTIQDIRTTASPTFANLGLGTGELTAGSINRGAGTLTLEIAGTAEISITSTTITLGGNLVIPDAGQIGSTSDTNAITISATGIVDITAHDGSTTGLSLGGTLVTSTAAELNLLDGITAVQEQDAGLDSLAGLTYAAASFVKMTGANTFALRTIGETADDLQGTIDHDLTANYDANKHIDHTGVTLTAGTGLTGGGDISASRTFAVDGVLEDLDTLGAPTLSLYDYHNTGDTTTAGVTTTAWRAMTFTTTSAYTIGGVKLKLYADGVVPDYVVASIRATDGTIPTGDDLASGEIAGSELAAASPGSWVAIAFDTPLALSITTKYAIVVRTKTSGTSDWRLDVGGGYATGSRCDSANEGDDWIEGTVTHDYMFECYGGVQFIVATGPGVLAYQTATTAATSMGLGTGDSPTFTGLTITNCCVLGSDSAVFQPNTDAVTFFQVLDADGGIPVLNVDTTNERVGVGTAAPSLKFDVKGAANTSYSNCPLLMQVHTLDAYADGMGGGISLGGEYGSVNTTTFGYIAGLKDGAVEGDTAGKLILGARPTGGGAVDMTAVTILGTGYVGVGVTDPDTKLEVFHAGNQLKLSFDATDNAIFAVDTAGVLTITPSGAAVDFASKNLTSVDAISCAHLGVGSAADANTLVFAVDTSLETTVETYGGKFWITKTAGVTDHTAHLAGIHATAELNHDTSTNGYLRGLYGQCKLILGDLGDATHAVRMTAISAFANVDAGKIYGEIRGIGATIDQEAANEVTGDVAGIFIQVDLDGTVGGTSHMLYLNELTGIDYGIYQNGTAMNVLGGPLMVALKTGTDQADASAAAGELYVDTNDDNTVKMGV